ncbi:ovarian-specific serine/threonine-protein kinase Lok isoform X2 [Stomoxys calcitrans]|uniref:non-specific serine/threonine protein kinase n=1 Tax=Stomoxys calcitrans TaxID=35570 RepID=A0A1I8P361_STOCA|nr:ovarian-specific serine/threonine-protein kinase Lok isoform X2 [Stomoxys calcitrans]
MARDREPPQSHTQGATQSQVSNLWSQVESQPIENIVWGRLYGKNVKVKSLDLNNESFTAGRGENNDLMLTTSDLPEKILCRISKVHFIIKRANCDLSNPVYIEDHSRNGTFVNSERVGTNSRRILQNDDIISLSHPTYKAFVFKDLSPNEAMGLPKEITSNYYVSRKLGSGACGLVRLVYDRRSCQEYAMKIVKKNMLATSTNPNNLTDPNRVMNEAKIMKNLDHPCVINMHDIVDKPDSVYMVLEFMKGGDLLNRIVDNKRLSEKISKLFFYQMCHAVKYLHDKGITHRDIKPDNVLLDSADEETLLKVSDFGLSKFVQKDSVMRTLCGTPLYVAPEVLLTGGRGAYTKKVDIWSLGVVLFTCLSGTLPFSDDYGSPACEQIKRGHFRFNHPSWKQVSQRATSLIKNMLIVDPQRRPTIDDVLQSSWLKDADMLRTANKLMKIEAMETEDEENFLEPPMKRSKR